MNGVATARLTLRVLAHELRTPINHIIGYSEMLLEDMADAANPAGLRALHAIHATGKELLRLVNTELGAAPPDALVSPELLGVVRVAAQRSIERILTEHREASRVVTSPAAACDVTKILDATTRLAEFARSGTVRAIE